MTQPRRPVALVVLDGWGIAPPGPGNAVALAHTPVFDALMAHYPHTQLSASGLDVGLPAGQMGNSEVGHLNLGAGRVVYQHLTRISLELARDGFASNMALRTACEAARATGGALHLIGLASTGGVHAHIAHLVAIVRLAAGIGVADIRIHAITDGRDVAPDASLVDLVWLESQLAAVSASHAGVTARIVTVVGRFWAMDRDARWERTHLAWELFAHGRGRHAASADAAVRESHVDGITDEFVEPYVIGAAGSGMAESDVVVFTNFRPDRMRQLVPALVLSAFTAFPRGPDTALPVHAATFTEYDPAWGLPVAFAPDRPANVLADVLELHSIGQLHAAETEKYPHVTYFFNGGREASHRGELRELAPSPRDVATYDLRPEMSAAEVADRFIRRWLGPDVDFGIINFANPDMVGHSGVIGATIEAVETADQQLGRVLDAVRSRGGSAIVTADHGNAETLLTDLGTPHTAHTTNLVPCICVGDAHRVLRAGGRLADIAPTVLELLGLPVPQEMTGRSLLSVARRGSAAPAAPASPPSSRA